MLSYSTELLAEDQQDLLDLRSLLENEKTVFNIASKIQFYEKKKSLKILHDKIYKNVRKNYPTIKAQVIIRAEHGCLAAYKSIKSNKYKIKNQF